MATVHRPSPLNFNAGPAALPRSVLEACREGILDFADTGMSVMEHSHRGAAYEAMHHATTARLRTVFGIPDGAEANGYDILLVQGGASQQFAQVAMNLLPPTGTAGYVVTGSWGEKAIAEARSVAALCGRATVRLAASTLPGADTTTRVRRVATSAEIVTDRADAYLHLTSNETIDGVQYAVSPGAALPHPGEAPLIVDMSSDIAWRPMDLRGVGLIYAGAQKNLGPSGVTVVIVRRDLVAAGRKDIPTIFQYRTFAKNASLYNTPPTFAIYVMGLVLEWIEGLGGLEVIEARNRAKADAIYGAINAFPEVYRSPVENASRSQMNVVFTLASADLEERFLAEAEAHGMVGLRGHRSVGGVRASLYNAVEPATAQALAQLMHDFGTRVG